MATSGLETNQRRPLDECFDRVRRAGEHLLELERVIESYRKAQEDISIAEFDPGKPSQIKLCVPGLSPPPHISILIGEICYNLRSALDYLVRLVSILDSGSEPKSRTQFLIEAREKDFSKRVQQGWLGEMSTEHRAIIKGLQPYNGCDWTRELARISNEDKHSRLTVTVAASSGAARVVAGTRDLLGKVVGGHPVSSTVRDDGLEMHMHFKLALNIEFANGSPVMETLEVIKSQVTKTLRLSKPEFQ